MTDSSTSSAHHIMARSYEEYLQRENKALERIFNAGNEGALYEIMVRCLTESRCEGKQPFLGQKSVTVPRWVLEAALTRVKRYMLRIATKGTGRTSKWSSRFRQDMVDFDRYDCVQEAREIGVTWENVYDKVADILAGTPSSGSPDTIRGSYKRVNKRMKTEPHRYRVFRYVKVKGLG